MELYKYTFEYFTTELSEEDFTLYYSVGMLLPYENYDLPGYMEWEWGKVKEAQYIFSQKDLSLYDMCRALAIVKGCKAEDLLQWVWFDVFKLYKFVIKELTEVNNLETANLAYEPDDLNVVELSEPLNKFGHFGTLMAITNNDLTKFEAYEWKPYREVFTALFYLKTQSDVREKIEKYYNTRHVRPS